MKTPSTYLNAHLQQLCRRFSETVDGSARLQYNIELAIAGMEDGCPDEISPSTAEKREALEVYSKSWHDLRFPDKIDLAMQHNVRFATSDGYVLVRITTTNILEVIQFPSRTRHPHRNFRTWTIPGAVIADEGVNSMAICAVDSTQDLLVVVEQGIRYGRVPLPTTHVLFF